MRTRFRYIAVAAVAAAFAVPAAAQAGTVRYSEVIGPTGSFHVLALSDTLGENNDVWAGRRSSSEIWFEDSAPITDYPGLKCHPATPLFPGSTSAVSCDTRAVGGVRLYLGGGINEAVAFGSLPTVVSGVGAIYNRFTGGAAADLLIGGNGADQLNGGAGNDIVHARGGNDQLHGGPGRDELSGEDGTDLLEGGLQGDVFAGGSGTDVVTYATRSGSVRVSIDNVANDGESHEGDYVRTDVEHVEGGTGDDMLAGPSGDTGNALSGGPGNDMLSGGGGKDWLWGGAGFDVLRGGPGGDHMSGGANEDTVSYEGSASPVTADLDGVAGDDGAPGEHDEIAADVERLIGSSFGDTLSGNAAANRIRGGAGNDLIVGLAGSDQLFGEAGADRVVGADGAKDHMNCGDGKDSFEADALDLVVYCEADDPDVGDPSDSVPGGTDQGGATASPMRIGPAKVRLTKRGVARLRIACPADAAQGCKGRLRLRLRRAGKPMTVGSRGFSLAAGRRGVVRVRVARSIRRHLGRSGIRVRAVARMSNAAAASRPARRLVRILPPRAV